MSLIDATLADILVCPKCHGSLTEDEPQRLLVCASCQLGYSVREDGIPVMLIDEARDLSADS